MFRAFYLVFTLLAASQAFAVAVAPNRDHATNVLRRDSTQHGPCWGNLTDDTPYDIGTSIEVYKDDKSVGFLALDVDTLGPVFAISQDPKWRLANITRCGETSDSGSVKNMVYKALGGNLTVDHSHGVLALGTTYKYNANAWNHTLAFGASLSQPFPAGLGPQPANNGWWETSVWYTTCPNPTASSSVNSTDANYCVLNAKWVLDDGEQTVSLVFFAASPHGTNEPPQYIAAATQMQYDSGAFSQEVAALPPYDWSQVTLKVATS